MEIECMHPSIEEHRLLQGMIPRAKYKLVFLGDESVGKTSLITRFMYNHFEDSYQATIGIDFLAKTIYLPNRVLRLQLWDTAGQERFRSLIPAYIRDSSVAVVVYDITNRNSFKNTEKWIQDVRDQRGTPNVLIMLVANKLDLSDEMRVITTNEGIDKAKKLGVLFLESSAKTGYNVHNVFQQIAQNLPQQKPKIENTEIHLKDSKYAKSRSGCWCFNNSSRSDNECNDCIEY